MERTAGPPPPRVLISETGTPSVSFILGPEQPISVEDATNIIGRWQGGGPQAWYA